MLWYYVRLLFSAEAYQTYLKEHPTALADAESAFERAKPGIKAAMLGLGAALASGQINIGPLGYWIATVLIGGQSLVQKKITPAAVTAAQVAQTPEQKTQVAMTMPPEAAAIVTEKAKGESL
jgi:hypothetical protein